jgi:hypothetical protein
MPYLRLVILWRPGDNFLGMNTARKLLLAYRIAGVTTLIFQIWWRSFECGDACPLSFAKAFVWATIWPAFWFVFLKGFLGLTHAASVPACATSKLAAFSGLKSAQVEAGCRKTRRLVRPRRPKEAAP